MLQQLMIMYTSVMTFGTSALVPHIVGPSGTGKSTVMRQLAKAFGVKLRVVNVSRLNPLEIEGAQIPVNMDSDAAALQAMLSPMWCGLNDGDIVLFDEFLGRGFPEVYNALLDIITSREVGDFKLPKLFFVAASNSVAAYDPALEDRLNHMFVPDIRKDRGYRKVEQEAFVKALGLLDSQISYELDAVFDNLVLPTYNFLDKVQKLSGTQVVNGPEATGYSTRHLICATQMRAYLHRPELGVLRNLIAENNREALRNGLHQFVLAEPGGSMFHTPAYTEFLELVREDQMLGFTPACRSNVLFAQQLLKMEGVGV